MVLVCPAGSPDRRRQRRRAAGLQRGEPGGLRRCCPVALPAFALVRDWVLGIGGRPTRPLAIATNVLSALTGSASGGLTIALDALGPTYMRLAGEQGIDPAAATSGGGHRRWHAGQPAPQRRRGDIARGLRFDAHPRATSTSSHGRDRRSAHRTRSRHRTRGLGRIVLNRLLLFPADRPKPLAGPAFQEQGLWSGWSAAVPTRAVQPDRGISERRYLARLSLLTLWNRASVRYHGACTPSAWLTAYRLAGDNQLDRFGDRGMDMAESSRRVGAGQQAGRDCRHDRPSPAAARPISR